MADARGRRSRSIVAAGLTALRNLDHRGAAGRPNSGDGAGILTQVPDALLRASVDFELPPLGEYSVGIAFLPADGDGQAARVKEVAALAEEEGLNVLGWRDVPIDPEGADLRPASAVGTLLRSAVRRRDHVRPGRRHRIRRHHRAQRRDFRLERRSFYVLRKRAERAAVEAGSSLYFRLAVVADDHLQGHADHRPAAAVLPRPARRALRVGDRAGAQPLLDQHVPELAAGHPFQFIAHNGEINTIKGNRNRMRAREAKLDTTCSTGPPVRPPSWGWTGSSRSPRATSATRPPSTRCSSCCTCPAGRCRTRC